MKLRDELGIDAIIRLYARQFVHRLTAQCFLPPFLGMRAMNRLTRRNAIRPRFQPPRIAKRRKLARNYPQGFLQYVLRRIGVADNRTNVLEERLLNPAKNLIERLSGGRRRPGVDKNFFSAR
jgi:hypothetical protein